MIRHETIDGEQVTVADMPNGFTKVLWDDGRMVILAPEEPGEPKLDGDRAGHAFRGNQFTGGIPEAFTVPAGSAIDADVEVETGTGESDLDRRQAPNVKGRVILATDLFRFFDEGDSRDADERDMLKAIAKKIGAKRVWWSEQSWSPAPDGTMTRYFATDRRKPKSDPGDDLPSPATPEGRAEYLKMLTEEEPAPKAPKAVTPAKGIDVYHGTVQQHVDSILKRGITVAASKKHRNYPPEFYSGDRAKAVFVTSTHGAAMDYAIEASTEAVNRTKGALDFAKVRPVIIHARVPRAVADHLLTADHAGEVEDLVVHGDIKPEWIVGVEVRESGPFESPRWAPYKRADEADDMVDLFLVTFAPADDEE